MHPIGKSQGGRNDIEWSFQQNNALGERQRLEQFVLRMGSILGIIIAEQLTKTLGDQVLSNSSLFDGNHLWGD